MQRSLVFPVAASVLVATAVYIAPTPAGAEEKASDPRDRIICRRFSKTGSLVASYRTCKTRWEWERERENLRQLNPVNSCKTAEGGPCGI